MPSAAHSGQWGRNDALYSAMIRFGCVVDVAMWLGMRWIDRMEKSLRVVILPFLAFVHGPLLLMHEATVLPALDEKLRLQGTGEMVATHIESTSCSPYILLFFAIVFAENFYCPTAA